MERARMDSRGRAVCTKEGRMVAAMAMAATIFLSMLATGSAVMSTSPHSRVEKSKSKEADASFLAGLSFRRILQAGAPPLGGPAPDTSSSNICRTTFGGKDIVFQNCQDLEGEFTLRWNVTSATTVTISFSQQHAGWIGFGLSPTGQMVGSSAVCGFPSSSTGASVFHYFLGAQSRDEVKPPGRLAVSDMRGEFVDGEMRLMFNLELTAEQMARAGTLWAKGEHRMRTPWTEGDQGISTDPTLTEHTPFNSYTGFVSFGTGRQVGQTTVGARSSSLKNAHGMLNALAWGFLIPIGAIMARYAKVHDPTWFYTHVAFQSLGFVIGVVGFITGKISNGKSKGEYPTHCNIAIAILVFSSLQVVAGVFRPHKDAKIRWAWNYGHHWGGRLLIMLAIINVYIGLDILKPGRSWVIAYSFIVLVLGTSTVLLEIKKLWQAFIAPEPIKQLDRVLTSLHVNVEDQTDEDDARGPKL